MKIHKLPEPMHFFWTRGDIIDIDFHLHDGYEIYFLISGDVDYFVDNKVYSLKHHEMMITNPFELHTPVFRTREPYERAVVEFLPEIPLRYSRPDFNLLECFHNRANGEKNKISLEPAALRQVTDIFGQLKALAPQQHSASEIMKEALLVQLLVILNQAFLKLPPSFAPTDIPEPLEELVEYIGQNLHSDLSMVALEKRFFLDRSYMSRLFKQWVGIRLHEYIIHKRIAKAKELLIQDCNVTETCFKTGFNDYSNFIRMFKRIVGMTPGRYVRSAKGLAK